MKVAITGATGLIGVHTVARLLDQGHEVRVLVRDPGKLNAILVPFGVGTEPVEQMIGDITRREDVERLVEGCDAVIHAAGLFSDDHRKADLMRQINVQGTRTLLEAAADHGSGTVIYVSSYLALFPPLGPMICADDPVAKPKNLYASTKADAERVAREWQQRGLPLTIIYPGAVHGPFDPTFSTGPAMIARYVRDGVLVTEGGLVYTDVRDLAAVCVAALANTKPARHMFGGFFLTHAELLRLLRELTGRPIPELKIPGSVLRMMGRVNDWMAVLRSRPPQLTGEAATVLTRTVPCDDRPTLEAFGIAPISARDSFRDLLIWMYRSGKLRRADVGNLAEAEN